MATLNEIANNKKNGSLKDGNADVRFKDSTDKVAKSILSNTQPTMPKVKNSGCSSCNR